jgi:hypothetical protein
MTQIGFDVTRRSCRIGYGLGWPNQDSVLLDGAGAHNQSSSTIRSHGSPFDTPSSKPIFQHLQVTRNPIWAFRGPNQSSSTVGSHGIPFRPSELQTHPPAPSGHTESQLSLSSSKPILQHLQVTWNPIWAFPAPNPFSSTFRSHGIPFGPSEVQTNPPAPSGHTVSHLGHPSFKPILQHRRVIRNPN